MSLELEIAERCLGHTEGEALVSVRSERSLVRRFARSLPSQATAVENLVVEVLCVHDGHTATASTNATDAESLRSVARRAREAVLATAGLAGERGGYPGLPGPAPARAHEGHDAATAALDGEAGERALAGAFAELERVGAEAFGIWTAGEVRTAVCASTGQAVSDAVTDAHMRVIGRDSEGRSGFAAHTAPAAGALDGAALARRAATGLDPREPVSLAPGSYPVVLEAEAVGELLDFLAVLAFNGQAHAEGRGALCGRLGTKVAAAAINLSDSPRYPGTLPRAFDAEGVPKRPLPLIQDGVAHAVAYDTRSGALAGAQSTGHALAAGGGPPGPVPTNLVLVGGGAADEHELAAPIERGIYVRRLWYVNPVHEQRTLLTGMTRDGTRLIEDGRIDRPLRNLRFTDEALGVLARVEALGSRPRLISEASLYERHELTGTVCPPVRAGALRVTAATR